MTDKLLISVFSKEKKKRVIRKYLFVYLMLAIPLLHFLIFWVYVNISSILLTFQRFNVLTGGYEWYGLKRYSEILEDIFIKSDPVLINSIKNSLSVFVVGNFIILPLAFFSSFYLTKKIWFSKVFRVLFFVPSIISITVLTLSFKMLFSKEFGPIDAFLRLIFNTTPEWFSMYSNTAMPMVFLFCVWAGMGYNVVLISGAMMRIPQEIFEAGKLDGLKPGKEMFKIVMPLIGPTLSTLIILNTMAIFTFYLQPYLLVSDIGGIQGSVSTIAMQIFLYVQKSTTRIDAATIGILFSLFGIPIVFLIKFIVEKIFAQDIEF